MSIPLERIAYVEDEPDIRSIAEFALVNIGGFTVELCGSGSEAIERTPAFEPDMILLDVMMPGMDGIETFRRLRQIDDLKATPILFMTAKAMDHEIEQYMALGAADVITKPFDPLTLPEQLRLVWEQLKRKESEPAAGGQAGDDLQNELRALLHGHHANLMKQIDTLGRLLNDSGAPGADRKVLVSNAKDLAHQIKGAGGSIGFPAVSAAATELDAFLKRFGKPPAPMSAEEYRTSLDLFAELHRTAQATTPESSILYNADLSR